MRRYSLLLILLILSLFTACGNTSADTKSGNAVSNNTVSSNTISSNTVNSNVVSVNTENSDTVKDAENMETVFNCKAQLIDKKTSSEKLTKIYKEALADGKQNGYTPVIVFTEDILTSTIENRLKQAEYAKSILANDHSNGKEWLDKTYAALEEYYGDELLFNAEGSYIWQSKPYRQDNSNFIPSASSFDGDVYLIQVPVTEPYDIFAYLPFCGWNECPDVDDMISVCKYWYEEYGAIPTTITYDTLTFYLETPVSDKNMAVKAAKEQCAFSSEELDMGGVEGYIGMTYNSSAWTFWWD